MKNILLVEDETDLAAITRDLLESYGYRVEIMESCEKAYERLTDEQFSMIILDINLPDGTGFEVCREIRACSKVPIIFISARSGETDKITGFDLGADDYLAKPFAMGELVARVKAMIRRNRDYQQTVLNLANVTLDLESNELSARSGSLILSVKEAKLLALFLEKESVSYSVEDIAGQVFQGEVSPEGITLYMAYLNNKLIQIHGNLQLVMKDDRICMEQKEGSD